MRIDKKSTLYTYFVNFSTCNFLFRGQNILLRIASKSHIRVVQIKGSFKWTKGKEERGKWKVKSGKRKVKR